MKKTTINKLKIIGIIIALFFTSLPLTTAIHKSSQKNDTQMVDIRVINTLTNTISYHSISQKEYQQLCNPIRQTDTSIPINEIINKKIVHINQLDIISDEQRERLTNRIELLTHQFPRANNNIDLFDFGAINLFNGIFFHIEGSKISSLLDLYVFHYQFLNTNFSALFTGYSEFQGHGFIISLGALAYQSIINYSFTEDPRFSEIKGSVIGFTGIIIEKDDTSGNDAITGIGLNVLTYWNEVQYYH